MSISNELSQKIQQNISIARMARLDSFCRRTINRFRNCGFDWIRCLLARFFLRHHNQGASNLPIYQRDKRQLESSVNTFRFAFLSDDQDFSRGSAGSIWCQETQADKRRAQRKAKPINSIINMPIATLKPNTNIRIRYRVPRNRRIEYEVEADQPVDTYVLDDKGLEEFDHGKNAYIYSYYGGFANRRHHQQELRLPFRGYWHLLIVSHNEEHVAVNYEVLSPE